MHGNTKTVGFFHYQVGRTDGVSLELAKWQQVFDEMGHKTWLFGGDVGASNGILIPEMFHHTPVAEKLQRATYHSLDEYNGNETAYRRDLFQQTDLLERKFKAQIVEKGIDLLIPQNVWSVAANPPVGLALARIMRSMKIPALAHNHDFYWERRNGVALTCKTAIDLALLNLPPRHPLAQHVVINSLAQKELLNRRGINATIVPNVFDFNEAPWQPDAYNRHLRRRIGLKENDIFILQATRIVARKGIELAIDFVRALNTPKRRAQLKAKGLYNGRPFDDKSRIVLVLAGYAQDDDTGYADRLKQKIARTGIDAVFIADMVDGERRTRKGDKIYSLWDAYVYADFVTYPSLWEGWGNQLLETLRAKLPMLIFEYPVYKADIADKGFQFVSLGDALSGRDDLGLVEVPYAVIQRAADEALTLLTDGKLYQETVNHNFVVGKRYYSMDALRRYITSLLRPLSEFEI